MKNKISDEELIEEITRLADDLGRVPSSADMKQCGKFSANIYFKRFESWTDAVSQAGYSPHEKITKIPRQDLIAEIQRLHDKLGKTPSQRDMIEQGEYSAEPYYTEFDGWKQSVRAAGFNPHTAGKRIPTEDLIAELKDVNREVEGIPTTNDMDEIGKYSSTTYENRFNGSWNVALKQANII